MEVQTLPQGDKLTKSVVDVVPPQKTFDQTPSGQDQTQSKPKPKKRSSFRTKRKGKPGKIHIRLPSIEAYQKEICFPAEAPGRVVVRLERLMGSDKIRPVDGKYMETLIQRLEEEEFLAWERKIRLRKKAEKERHRQLAINGLMEPGPGMEDLYNHPVFRVNRILNRLSRLDNAFANQPGQKVPPISQIDPFKYDDNGRYFCDYPTHVALRKQCEKYHDEAMAVYNDQLLEDMDELNDALAGGYSTKSYVDFVASSAKTKVTTAPPPSEASVPVAKREEDDESETDEELEGYATAAGIDEEVDGEGVELTELETMALNLQREYMESLTTLQDKYGVTERDNFEEMWKPYRSDIVETFFNDPDSLESVYSAAREIMEVYTRQDIVTREHVKHNPLTVEEKKSISEAYEEEEGEGEDEYAAVHETISMPELSEESGEMSQEEESEVTDDAAKQEVTNEDEGAEVTVDTDEAESLDPADASEPEQPEEDEG